MAGTDWLVPVERWTTEWSTTQPVLTGGSVCRTRRQSRRPLRGPQACFALSLYRTAARRHSRKCLAPIGGHQFAKANIGSRRKKRNLGGLGRFASRAESVWHRLGHRLARSGRALDHGVVHDLARSHRRQRLPKAVPKSRTTPRSAGLLRAFALPHSRPPTQPKVSGTDWGLAPIGVRATTAR